MEFETKDRLPLLKLYPFAQKLGDTLVPLLDFVCGEEMRSHHRWGSILPYDIPSYGEGRSLGHCIRPDVVLTDEGPMICELDFVPSGRGFLLASLPENYQKREILATFDKWYRLLSRRVIWYAVATKTICWKEVCLFSKTLNGFCGTEIRPFNIDELGDAEPDVILIDRLFYRSEMKQPRAFRVGSVVTQESFLDSKLIFAFVHDGEMEQSLLEKLGMENLLFLRKVFPKTYVLNELRRERPVFLEEVARDRSAWVIKNGDVETDSCWGSRGVLMGRKYTQKVFRDALVSAQPPNGKNLGAKQILQRFHQSQDFSSIWDGVVQGELAATDLGSLGIEISTQREYAHKHVYARLGFYLLVSNIQKKVVIPPYGILTLRQDELAHGASDAVYSAFKMV